MYTTNVALVKDYSSVSKDLKDLVVLNTQAMTNLTHDVRENQYCPQVRIEKQRVHIFGRRIQIECRIRQGHKASATRLNEQLAGLLLARLSALQSTASSASRRWFAASPSSGRSRASRPVLILFCIGLKYLMVINYTKIFL
jgi:hypothetical protein